jgi:hypothetical protein
VIAAYFDQIKATVDTWATTSFVLETQLHFEVRQAGQGYLVGSVTFSDSSVLHFRGYLDTDTSGTITRMMYTYHYQDRTHQLRFRYDNAHHKPPLDFTEHKHTPEQIVEAPAPSLQDVLLEITATSGWTLEE